MELMSRAVRDNGTMETNPGNSEVSLSSPITRELKRSVLKQVITSQPNEAHDGDSRGNDQPDRSEAQTPKLAPLPDLVEDNKRNFMRSLTGGEGMAQTSDGLQMILEALAAQRQQMSSLVSEVASLRSEVRARLR
jgi:hypothetical protein